MTKKVQLSTYSKMATKVKPHYKSPEITEIQVEIEKGFATGGVGSTGAGGEDGNWDYMDMECYDSEF